MTEYENMIHALLNNPKTNFMEIKRDDYWQIRLYMGGTIQILTYSANTKHLIEMDYIVDDEKEDN